MVVGGRLMRSDLMRFVRLRLDCFLEDLRRRTSWPTQAPRRHCSVPLIVSYVQHGTGAEVQIQIDFPIAQERSTLSLAVPFGLLALLVPSCLRSVASDSSTLPLRRHGMSGE